jgi:hypothetical protein
MTVICFTFEKLNLGPVATAPGSDTGLTTNLSSFCAKPTAQCRSPGLSFDYKVEAKPNYRNVLEVFGPKSKEKSIMRFMVIVKANKDSEAGIMPSEELLTEMGKFNEELVKAGVMLAGEGLQPSSKGARVRFSGEKRTVIDGPFAETKELVGGFWLWQCKSLEEAIEWARRCPNPTGEESELEIRQVFEAEDFGPEFTPELREQEERLRAEMEAKEVS